MKSNSNMWRRYFILAALEAGAAFVALAVVPHESGGYSRSRLLILIFLLGSSAGTAWLAWKPPAWKAAGAKRWTIIAAALLATGTGAALFLLRYLDPERTLPYYVRVAPALWFLLVAGAQLAVFLLVSRYGWHPQALEHERPVVPAMAISMSILVLAYIFVAVMRVGLTPDSAYWGEPGVPVLGWQFLLALGGATCLFLLDLRWQDGGRKDLLIAAVIWLTAVVIWLSVPTDVMRNSFYGPMDPPANQPFPNSDAGYYDSMAHSLLIGYPYQGEIPTRPLYILLLTVLHLAFGERYGSIIAGQTVLLALIPVVLYLLGQQIHSRAAGILVALIAIDREWNSLLISSQTRVSNTRTLLVDLPTLLLVLLACYLVVRWLQRCRRIDGLLAGCVMGALLLLRSQTILLLPVALGMGIIANGWRSRQWWITAGLFVLGAVAAVTPWLLHNYFSTGQLTLDAPFQYQIIASQYKYTGNLDLGVIDLRGKSLAGILIAFILKDPKFVLGFIGSHFFATLIDSLLALPLAARYDGLLAPLNLYWMAWPAQLDALNAVLLLGYLAVIAVGIGAAWMRLHWAGLVPLAFALGYALANGIGRFSGWRYDLPADWIAYFYVAVGAAELVGILARLLGATLNTSVDKPEENAAAKQPWIVAILIFVAVVFLGSLPWLAEGIAAPRYTDQSLPKLVSTLQSSSAVTKLGVSGADIEEFMTRPGTTLQIGRMLYPRYFPRNTGLSSAHPWPAYAVRDFPRVGFLLLNQSRHDVFIALKSAGAGFEQAADAIVLGCQATDHIEARLILFPGANAAYLSAPLGAACDTGG